MISCLIIILVIILAISNSVMDISSEDGFKHKWWNKNESWKNKHTNNVFGKTLPIWMRSKLTTWLLKNPLVFITDGWHLAQFIFHSSWQLLSSLYIAENIILKNSDKLNISDDLFITRCILFLVLKLAFSILFSVIYNEMKKD